MVRENEAFRLQAAEAQTSFDRDPEKMAALGYAIAEISLKEDDVPTLFPVPFFLKCLCSLILHTIINFVYISKKHFIPFKGTHKS